MMRSAFDHLILDVRSVERSLHFYRDQLGFEVRGVDELDGHHLAFLSLQGLRILLFQQPAPPARRRRVRGLVMKFRVSGLAEVAKQLKRQRVTVLQDVADEANGERTLLITDPDGYPILLSEPVETLH